MGLIWSDIKYDFHSILDGCLMLTQNNEVFTFVLICISDIHHNDDETLKVYMNDNSYYTFTNKYQYGDYLSAYSNTKNWFIKN